MTTRPLIDLLLAIDAESYRIDDAMENFPASARESLATIRRLTREAREASIEQRRRDRELHIAQRKAV